MYDLCVYVKVILKTHNVSGKEGRSFVWTHLSNISFVKSHHTLGP